MFTRGHTNSAAPFSLQEADLYVANFPERTREDRLALCKTSLTGSTVQPRACSTYLTWREEKKRAKRVARSSHSLLSFSMSTSPSCPQGPQVSMSIQLHLSHQNLCLGFTSLNLMILYTTLVMRISQSRNEYKPKDKTPMERTYKQHARQRHTDQGVHTPKEEVGH